MVENKCKYCGSPDIVKYGHLKVGQRWLCHSCHRIFAINAIPFRMRNPINYMGLAVDMYYDGISLSDIRRHLDQHYGCYPSESTVHRWVKLFTQLAMNEVRDYRANVGDVWIVGETVLKIGRNVFQFWDVIDAETKFLLVSHLCQTHDLIKKQREAQDILKLTIERCGKAPIRVLTDIVEARAEEFINSCLGAETEYILGENYYDKDCANLIKEFHNIQEARLHALRSLKKRESVELLMKGWSLRYNFFRVNESLGDYTPAARAGITFPFRNKIAKDALRASANHTTR